MDIIDDGLPELDELEEDEASKQDEPDAEPVLQGRRIFTDKLDLEVGALHSAWKAGDLVLDTSIDLRGTVNSTLCGHNVAAAAQDRAIAAKEPKKDRIHSVGLRRPH
jgi:hypothetical protein